MTAAGIPALLKPIQERLNAATPGPWTDALGKTFKAVGSIADARFIVNAPTDTARLLAAVKAVVEVHEPASARIILALPHTQADYDVCPKCFDDDGWPVAYPCPTVSAVEAALRDEACEAGSNV